MYLLLGMKNVITDSISWIIFPAFDISEFLHAVIIDINKESYNWMKLHYAFYTFPIENFLWLYFSFTGNNAISQLFWSA